jgi:hypothetical protein
MLMSGETALEAENNKYIGSGAEACLYVQPAVRRPI